MTGGAAALFDVPEITRVVREIAQELLASEKTGRSDRTEGPRRRRYDPAQKWLLRLIHTSTADLRIQRRLERSETGFRVHVADERHAEEIDACLCSRGLTKKKKDREPVVVLGSGSFGSVYQVDPTRCPGISRHVTDDAPKGKFEAAVKVQELTSQDDLKGWEYEADVTAKAGDVQVGPRVLGRFVCKQKRKKTDPSYRVFGFLIMERLRGVSLLDLASQLRERGKKRTDGAVVRKVKRLVMDHLQRMHRAGIMHNDLHDGNVMVLHGRSGSGEALTAEDIQGVRIIDYGLSSLFVEGNVYRTLEHLDPVSFDDVFGIHTEASSPREERLSERILEEMKRRKLVRFYDEGTSSAS